MNSTYLDVINTDLIGTGRSSGDACPTQTGFNAFAFLAFILLAIDTIMNINNNLNNSNNNRNNNNRNNNNNNMFESMNMNMNTGKRKKKSIETGHESINNLENMIIEEQLSPWDKRIFEELMNSSETRGLDIMEKWILTTMKIYPSCLLVIPCQAAQEWTNTNYEICPNKFNCPLFD